VLAADFTVSYRPRRRPVTQVGPGHPARKPTAAYRFHRISEFYRYRYREVKVWYFLGMEIISPLLLVKGPLDSPPSTGNQSSLFSLQKKETSVDPLGRLQRPYTIISSTTEPYPFLIHHQWSIGDQVSAAILARIEYRIPASAIACRILLVVTSIRMLGMCQTALIPSTWERPRRPRGSKHGCHPLNPITGITI